MREGDQTSKPVRLLGDHGSCPISRRRAGEVQASRMPGGGVTSPRLSSPMTGNARASLAVLLCLSVFFFEQNVCLFVFFGRAPVAARLFWAVYILMTWLGRVSATTTSDIPDPSHWPRQDSHFVLKKRGEGGGFSFGHAKWHSSIKRFCKKISFSTSWARTFLHFPVPNQTRA